MKYLKLMLLGPLLGLAACEPNLTVQSANIDFTAQTVEVTVENTSLAAAGQHFTYIEINDVNAAAIDKPQTQYIADVSGISGLSTWSSGSIAFAEFSSPRGLDLTTLSTANLVVTADAKNLLEESDETDNIYDQNH